MVSMAAPMKHPKSGIYFFRKVIPVDVRDRLGKTEFRYSLHTKDPKHAKILAAQELAKAEALIESARSEKPDSIGPRNAQALAGEWLRNVLAKDLELRDQNIFPDAEREFRSDGETHVYDLEISHLDDDHNNLERAVLWVIEDMNDALQSCGMVLPDNKSESFRYLVEEFISAKRRYYVTLQDRINGQWNSAEVQLKKYPQYNPEKKPKAYDENVKTIRDMHSKWKAESQPTAKTADEYMRSIGEFEKVIGYIPLELITKTHIAEYKDHLLNNGGYQPATINKKLTGIKSLLSYAADNGYIESNPASNVRVKLKKGAKNDRSTFTNDDLKRIFAADVFTKGKRPKAGGGEAAYWLPILAVYTGARLEELGQLYVEDIQSHDGVSYIEFSNLLDDKATNTKRFKTGKSAHRVTPLHDDLISMGFLKYVQKVSKRSKRLFPELKVAADGSRTQNWSKWFNQRLLREDVGITDSDKVFHSFRHTFIRKGREARISMDNLRVLSGHTRNTRDAHSSYGGWLSPRGGSYPFSPKELKLEIDKIEGIFK